MAAFHFVTPSTPLPNEGGAAYVHHLAAALSKAGNQVTRDGAIPPGAVCVIDGAALAAVSPDLVRGAVGLIHHTTPMAAAETREAIAAAERERMPLLARVVATSEPVAERLAAEFGADPARLRVIRPGVPAVARSPGSADGGCSILSVGALVPRKGHDVLLRALARLLDLSWTLTIVGNAERDPAHAAQLAGLAAEFDMADRVQFAGTLDDPALEAAWRGADVFALATAWEGYSAPVAEALRRGLPVAVTNGGAAAELVPPEAGIVVHPGDVEQLSKAIRRVIYDGELRAEMAEAAWRIGNSLPTWDAQAALFAEWVLA